MIVRKQEVMSLKRNEINCIRPISIRSKYFNQIYCAVSGEIACTEIIGENNKGGKDTQRARAPWEKGNYRPNPRDRGSAYRSLVGLN